MMCECKELQFKYKGCLSKAKEFLQNKIDLCESKERDRTKKFQIYTSSITVDGSINLTLAYQEKDKQSY